MSNLPDRRGPEPRRSRWGDRSYEDTHDRSRALGWRIFVPSSFSSGTVEGWLYVGSFQRDISEVFAVADAYDVRIDTKRRTIHVYGPIVPDVLQRSLPSPVPPRNELPPSV